MPDFTDQLIMKIDFSKPFGIVDQVTEQNKAMNRQAGTVAYQANKVMHENDRLQKVVLDSVTTPSPQAAEGRISTILKKLNII